MQRLRAVALALLTTTTGVLPVFFLGALAVQVRGDLGFGETGVGTGVLSFFLVSAATSVLAGHAVERIGPRASITLATACATVSLLGIALVADSLPELCLFLGIGGIANGVAQPAANKVLATGVDRARQGLAFGIKQSAIPAATLIGGGAVPLVALQVGWRWVYGGAALVVPLALMLLPPAAAPAERSAAAGVDRRLAMPALVVLAVAACFGTAAGNSAAAFLVQSAVEDGVAEGTAGLLLAAASAAAIAGRVGMGWRADRSRREQLGIAVRMQAVGCAGLLVLAMGGPPLAVTLGALLALGVGWAFTGLINLEVVRTHAHAPAAATGVTQAGLYVGGMLGPLLFGAIAERLDFGVAWAAAATSLALAGALTLVARHLLRQADLPVDDPALLMPHS